MSEKNVVWSVGVRSDGRVTLVLDGVQMHMPPRTSRLFAQNMSGAADQAEAQFSGHPYRGPAPAADPAKNERNG